MRPRRRWFAAQGGRGPIAPADVTAGGVVSGERTADARGRPQSAGRPARRSGFRQSRPTRPRAIYREYVRYRIEPVSSPSSGSKHPRRALPGRREHPRLVAGQDSALVVRPLDQPGRMIRIDKNDSSVRLELKEQLSDSLAGEPGLACEG